MMRNLLPRFLLIFCCLIVATSCSRRGTGRLKELKNVQREPVEVDRIMADWRERKVLENDVREFTRELHEESDFDDPNNEDLTFDIDDGIDLREARLILLAFNPELLEARADAMVLVEKGNYRRPPIDMYIKGDLFKALAGGSGIKAVSLNYRTPWPSKIRREQREAQSVAVSALKEVKVKETLMLQELYVKWLEWSLQNDRIEIVEEEIERLETIKRGVEESEYANVDSNIGRRIIRLDIIEEHNELMRLRAFAAHQRLELLALLGFIPDDPVGLIPEIDILPVDSAEDDLIAAFENHPEIQAELAAYDVVEKQLRSAARGKYPDLEVGGGVIKKGASEYIGLKFKIPIQLLRDREGEIMTALAAREAAAMSVERKLMELQARLSSAQMMYAAAHDHRIQLEETLEQIDLEDFLLDLREEKIDSTSAIQFAVDILERVSDTKMRVLDAFGEEARRAYEVNQFLIYSRFSDEEFQNQFEPAATDSAATDSAVANEPAEEAPEPQ